MLVLNLLNRIFGNKGDLSRSEIDSYVNEKRELQKIEEKSLSDDFNADALEGFEKHGLGTDAMRSLDEKMKPNENTNKVLYIALFSTAALVLVLLSLYGVKKLQSNDNQQQLAVLDKEEDEPKFETKIESTEPLEEEVMDEVPSPQSTTENFIGSKEKKSSQTNTEDPVINFDNDGITNESRSSFDQFGSDEGAMLSETLRSNQAPRRAQPQETTNLSYKSVKEVYFHDYKLVDYRPHRSGDRMEEREDLPGVPADQMDVEDQEGIWNDSDAFTEKKVSYISYLEETMRLMKLGKVDVSIKRFKKIHSFYPDDVNAHFYLGILYYEKGNFKSSIFHLESSFSFFYGNFYEEAQFYIAKCYIGLGEELKAKKTLRKIIANEGFYSNQAKELLKGL